MKTIPMMQYREGVVQIDTRGIWIGFMGENVW